MIKCNVHEFFFESGCHTCKEEYKELKGTNALRTEENYNIINTEKKKNAELKTYKEFNEERAKKLFEEIFLQYLKKGNISEEESLKRSKTILRKQCEIRGINPWSWI